MLMSFQGGLSHHTVAILLHLIYHFFPFPESLDSSSSFFSNLFREEVAVAAVVLVVHGVFAVVVLVVHVV